MNKKNTLLKIMVCVVVSVAPIKSWGGVTNSDFTGPGSDLKSAAQQQAEATKGISNPAFGLANAVNLVSALSSSMGSHKKGLQFKSPIFSPAFSFRTQSDDSPGGFDGDEYTGELGLDADVYDGLIAGLIYQHSARSARNNIGTKESLDSDGFSLYFGKRFFDLLNTGLAYHYANTEHQLTGAAAANLDRDSNGFSLLAGISDKKGKWSWSSTTSFSFIHDGYDKQTDLETGRFGWGGGLGYDASKHLTVGAAFTYYNFIFQDTFPNSVVSDNDYWTLGPRFQYFPYDDVTVYLDFDSQQGYVDYSAYTVRVGANIAF